MAKVTITLQDGEYIARHADHKGIIGVGDTEQEALQELAEALGALAYSLNVVDKKKDELLELYKEINNKRKELITLARHNTWSWKLDIEIKDIQDKIKALEKELKEGLE